MTRSTNHLPPRQEEFVFLYRLQLQRRNSRSRPSRTTAELESGNSHSCLDLSRSASYQGAPAMTLSAFSSTPSSSIPGSGLPPSNARNQTCCGTSETHPMLSLTSPCSSYTTLYPTVSSASGAAHTQYLCVSVFKILIERAAIASTPSALKRAR